MRTIPVWGAGLVVFSAAAMLVACAPTYTNPKKLSREDVAVDVLDCQKAAVLKYKAARLRNSEDSTSYEARQRAAAAGRAAYERCLNARGWKKNG